MRAARAWTQDGFGVSVWDVAESELDDTILRQRLEAIVDRRIDAGERLSRVTPVTLEPTVAVRPEASPRATVIEVRSTDRPGLIHVVCAALARMDVSVRSAHVSTLGPQASAVFYVQETLGGRALRGTGRLGRTRRPGRTGGHLRAAGMRTAERGAATLDDWS